MGAKTCHYCPVYCSPVKMSDHNPLCGRVGRKKIINVWLQAPLQGPGKRPEEQQEGNWRETGVQMLLQMGRARNLNRDWGPKWRDRGPNCRPARGSAPQGIASNREPRRAQSVSQAREQQPHVGSPRAGPGQACGPLDSRFFHPHYPPGLTVTPGPCCLAAQQRPPARTTLGSTRQRRPRRTRLARPGRKEGALSSRSTDGGDGHTSAANENRTCWHRRHHGKKRRAEVAAPTQRHLPTGGRTAPRRPIKRLGRDFLSVHQGKLRFAKSLNFEIQQLSSLPGPPKRQRPL